MESKGEIYIITCGVNGKQYIGQAVCFKRRKNTLVRNGTEGRYKIHVAAARRKDNRCCAISSAMQKYGVHNFSVKTLLICDKCQLDYYETKYIRQHETMAPKGYNLRTGGCTAKFSEASRKKLSESMTGAKNNRYGTKHTQATLELMAKAKAGKVLSEETKKRISVSKRKEANSDLPMYIYNYSSRGKLGYHIKHHAGLKLIRITHKCFTVKPTKEENLLLALEYLHVLDKLLDDSRCAPVSDKH
jgi:group I intron endonuclease